MGARKADATAWNVPDDRAIRNRADRLKPDAPCGRGGIRMGLGVILDVNEAARLRRETVKVFVGGENFRLRAPSPPRPNMSPWRQTGQQLHVILRADMAVAVHQRDFWALSVRPPQTGS